jgi:glycerol-3-phosphate acyltransferase PlsY
MTGTALSFNYYLYLLIPAAFIMGSIPFGIIFTRNKGIDPRSIGSKNIGATNVLRAAGKTPAILTLLGDVLKGALPVIICKYIIMNIDVPQHTSEFQGTVEDLWLGITGVSAVLGHMLSIFLSFRGGKGVATGFGVLLIYSPAAAGIMLIIWLSVAFIFKYSALAALIAVAAMPFVLILLKASTVKLTIGLILATLIIYKHKSNIRNLLSGTEDKIGGKS